MRLVQKYRNNRQQGKFPAKNTTIQSAGVAGGIGGAWIGMKLGAAAGAAGGPYGAIGGL